MGKTGILILGWLLGMGLAASDGVKLAILRTGVAQTRERFAMAGGRWTAALPLDHAAFLVVHRMGTLLFDTGLGEAIDGQYHADMPLLARPLFAYHRTESVRSQLQRHGLPQPDRILLSHLHWDHASGLGDFPGIPVWAHRAEREHLQGASPVTTFPSQVKVPGIPWVWFDLAPRPLGPFEASLDLFGDGSVVVVPLPGHSPGSVGLALRLVSGRRVLLVGDAVWTARALDRGAPRFWAAARLVDHDRSQALATVRRLQRFQQDHPEWTLVPSHDAEGHDRMGVFPVWVP